MEAKNTLRWVLFASMIGSALEYYDFYIYATASALVFNQLFFPKFSPLAGTLASFATLGVGFVARPFGGIFFGHLGDRLGRKPVLVATLILVGGGTTLIGLLPTFDQIGLWAPALLLVLRLAQGFGTGAEYGGAIIMAAEYAPPHRRGLFACGPAIGVSIGNLLSFSAFALITYFWKDEILVWAWRIPFLASIFVVLLGIYVRRRIAETPTFAAVRDKGHVKRLPLAAAFRERKKSLLIVVFTQMGQNGMAYMFGVFGLAYVTTQLAVPRSDALMALLVADVIQIATIVAAAMLSDRIGRRPVYMAAAIFTASMAFPFFWLLGSGSLALVYVGFALAFGVGYAGMLGTQPAFFAELFGPSTRFSGFATAREIGTLIGGAPVPFISVALVAWMGGQPWGVACYIVALCLITTVTVYLSPETHRRDLDDEVVGRDESSPAQLELREAKIAP
jgi:MFS transporter, MHS family, shikimate and dehydroshikimate transport protein